MAGAKRKRVSKTTYSAPALEKGFDIIELLATAPDGLTSSELAQKLGRSLSEIFRILVVMERRAWLHKSSETDRYAVSYHVLETAFRASPVQALGVIAAPVMYELSQATVQSCHMVVLSDTAGLIVLQQDLSRPFRIRRPSGHAYSCQPKRIGAGPPGIQRCQNLGQSIDRHKTLSRGS